MIKEQIKGRYDIEKINKFVQKHNYDQKMFNLFLLINDILYAHAYNNIGFNSFPSSISDDYIEKISNPKLITFINELYCKDIEETRFILKKSPFENNGTKFLKYLYSLDGSPLKTIDELRKDYTRFDERHRDLLLSLKNIILQNGDFCYLEEYLFGREDYNFFDIIVKTEEEIDCELFDNCIRINDVLKVLKEKNNFENCSEDVHDRSNNTFNKLYYDKIIKNKNVILLFLLKWELDKINDMDEKNDNFSKMINCDLSNFLEHINKTYNIDFIPDDEMVEEYEKFIECYEKCKKISKMNDLKISKCKLENNMDLEILNADDEEIANSLIKMYNSYIQDFKPKKMFGKRY